GNRNDAVTNAESLKAGILTAHQVKAAFETVSGRLVDRPIEEGMTVEAGAKLLAIDGTDIGLSIRQTEALIHQADAQIAAEEEGIRLALAEANTEEQTLWRQIEASEAARKSASAEWLRAEADWKRAQRLLPQGAMAQSDFDALKAAAASAREGLSSAERAVDAACVGARAEDRQKLSRTGSAEGMRLDAVVNARQAAENRRISLESLKAGREASAAALEQLKVNQSRLTLKAPKKAKVLEVLYEKGELVSPNAPAVLLESERLYFDIYVAENKVKGFQEGAKVTCWSPALNQDVRGTVLSVTAAPDFADLKMVRERGQADLTLFKVRINVEPAEGLLTGMTLEVKL
ncbi:HlyD family secretion protein, partial [Sutterella wadsworthensis]|uniref:HlyD family secretion protein n=1 Tax=Sutterella wadsworthensis TaxID=40545 RepID=UPI0039676630